MSADSILSAQFLETAIDKFNKTEYDSCIIYSRQSMKKSVKAKSWGRWYKGFEKIAYCHYYQGDFEKIIEESENYIEEIMANEGDSLHLARLYGWIGFSTFFIEEYDRGMKASLEGIKILEAINKQEEGTRLYQNVGIEYTKRGDYEKAISYLEIAENYSLKQSKTENLSAIWTNMALAFGAMNEHHKCIDICYKIKELNGLNFSIVMMLSESYRELDDYEKSKFYLEVGKQFLDDKKENSFEYHIQKASLGMETGNSNVEKDFNEAIKVAKNSELISDREIAITYIKLGEFYESYDMYELAKRSFSEALIHLDSKFKLKSIWQQDIYNDALLGNEIWIMEALHGLAKSEKGALDKEFSSEGLDKTLVYFMNCFFVIENLRLNVQTESSKLHMSEYVNQIYENGLSFIFGNINNFQDDKKEDIILYILEKSRSFVLSSNLQEVKAKSISGIPDSLLRIEESLKKNIAVKQKKGIGNLDKYDKEELFKKQRDLEKLNRLFEESFPMYAKVKFHAKVPSIEKVRTELLVDNQAIIYYFWGQEHLFSFLLSKKNLLITRLDLVDVSETLMQYQNMLNNRSFDAQPEIYYNQFNKLSFSLFSSLLSNNLEELENGIDELIVIPDGNLHLLSFESLIKSIPIGGVSYSLDNMEYLIEDFAISYANSIDLIYKQKSGGQNEFVNVFSGFAPSFDQALGDSYYRKCSGEKMTELKFNKQEILSILSITGGNKYFSKNASINAFVDEAKKSKVIHLATHACANSTDINQNRIYFSKNEYLSTNDIYQMDIRAEMIVLSACETGLGKFATGEGVMSLARGFTFAGVPSILMSLWSIPDQSTSTIMSKYYSYLADGNGKSKALQLAKLDFIREASLLQKHPHFWSSMVVIGNIKSISFDHEHFNWAYLIGFLAFIIVILYGFFKSKKLYF